MLLIFEKAPGRSTTLRKGTGFDIVISVILELTAPFAEDRKMKTQKLAAVLLTLTLSLGASQGALAHHDDTCVDEVNAVGTVIAATTSFTNVRDQERLRDKVIEALLKLNQHKATGALKKVGNIRAKVEELRDARKTKISATDASAILTAVGNAEMCLNAIL